MGYNNANDNQDLVVLHIERQPNICTGMSTVRHNHYISVAVDYAQIERMCV